MLLKLHVIARVLIILLSLTTRSRHHLFSWDEVPSFERVEYSLCPSSWGNISV